MRNAKQTSIPLFAVLLGALAFNLSSWPEAKTNVSNLSLTAGTGALIESCLNRKLDETDEAACDVDDGSVKGVVKVRKITRQIKDRDNKEDPDAKKTIERWEVSADLETECNQGCENGVRKSYANAEFEDLREAATKSAELFLQQAAALKKEAAAEKEKLAKRERCEVDADGKELTEDAEIVTCKMARTRNMKADEAAAYYDDEIQPVLQDMLSCNSFTSSPGDLLLNGQSLLSYKGAANTTRNTDRQCAAQRNKAMRLLERLAKGYSRNPYIKNSLADLMVFGDYNRQVDQLSAFNSLAQNDPRRRAAAQQLAELQQRWGGYLAQRGLVYERARDPLGWEAMSIGSGLTDDLTGYNAAMTESFARVAQMHQQYLNATGQNTQTAQNTAAVPLSAGNGRNARGMPSTSYAGGPQAAAPGVTAPGAAPAPGQQPFQPLNNHPAGRPLNGSNIIKPTLGQPVR